MGAQRLQFTARRDGTGDVLNVRTGRKHVVLGSAARDVGTNVRMTKVVAWHVQVVAQIQRGFYGSILSRTPVFVAGFVVAVSPPAR